MRKVSAPCVDCPWRLDAPSGRFERERWRALQATSYDERTGSAPLGSPAFACHHTPEGKERACAGWLVREGAGNVTVRLAVAVGRLSPLALAAQPDWPALHPDLHSAGAADLEDPEWDR